MRISILVISITAACVMAAPKRKCKVHSNPQVSSTTAVPQAVSSSVAASAESLIVPDPVVVQNAPAAAAEQVLAEETVTKPEEAPAQADASTTEAQAPAPAPQAEAETSNAPAPAPQEEVEPAPAPAPQAQVEEVPAPVPAPQAEEPQKQVVQVQSQAQTGTTTSVTGMSATDDQAMLAAHNAFRASNGIGPLQYDSSIALHSVSWAKVLASQGCNLVHGDHDGLGQNLYMSSGTSTPRNSMQEMFDAWSSEDISPGGALNHATQALWPKTTKVGCAIAWGTSRNGWQCEVLVCNYSPPGNFVGKYWADV
ncbi:hypothetical protein CcCBS67573_g01627 [Chytriomyces confervae]|uniref:SCP domain-containing protein n=1 Tax=Chytriomyces confervae TaxID=246404 RepID=A0A507FNF4_9FUNG|nr:hypothetical protein HDU80_005537 [Chytriomyces hyalinus]TPX77115.1 hypothetical protein CcCBS67573_g01627 [Chytriomyces confervae]